MCTSLIIRLRPLSQKGERLEVPSLYGFTITRPGRYQVTDQLHGIGLYAVYCATSCLRDKESETNIGLPPELAGYKVILLKSNRTLGSE